MSSADLGSQSIIHIVDGQLMLGNELRLALAQLRKDAEGFIVHDSATCAEARQIAKRASDEIKQIIAACEPERLHRKKILQDWVDARDLLMAEFSAVGYPLEKAAREYNIAEVNAAQAEQQKLNKGQRAEHRVTVKPDIQTVSGTRFVVKYRCQVLNKSKIKREWMMPDIQRIEAEARSDKDPAKTEAKVGGVKILRT